MAVNPPTSPWLFSKRLDLVAFLLPVVLSLVLVLLAFPLGLDTLGPGTTDTPEWAWLLCVVLVDVAHVWGNLVLVYADPVERRRRPALYYGLPAIALALSIALASESELDFWRILALIAVWHFVRQQVGWVRLYRGKERPYPTASPEEKARASFARFIDEGTVYAVTLGPILWWHANLPRPFAWLIPHDFFLVAPPWVGDLGLGWAGLMLALYTKKALTDHFSGRPNYGKHLVVFSTALLWWLGIVAFASDYVFTVTNVLLHGMPYVVLIAVTARKRQQRGVSLPRVFSRGVPLILLTLIGLALLEEGLWDRLIWHEHGWLFPLPTIEAEDLRWLLVPLLAWPQLTHYLLDGFIWKRRDNPHIA